MFPETITLRHIGDVSRMGFGCWQLGGHGWQDLDTAALHQAVRDALSAGVILFDTADVYGLGQSEETLGTLLKDDHAVIATKFGVRFIDGKRVIDNDPGYIRTALDESRTRLKRDVIDLYQLHWHDGKTDLRRVFDALEDLRNNGAIRAYGICNVALDGWTKADLPEGLATFSFEHSLIARQHEETIRHMQDHLGLTFISWGSLAQGLLAGRYARGHRFAEGDVRARPGSIFAPENWDRYEPILDVLRAASAELNQPMGRIALRWILDTAGGVTLAGIKNTAQLADNIQAFGWHLPDHILTRLNEVSDA